MCRAVTLVGRRSDVTAVLTIRNVLRVVVPLGVVVAAGRRVSRLSSLIRFGWCSIGIASGYPRSYCTVSRRMTHSVAHVRCVPRLVACLCFLPALSAVAKRLDTAFGCHPRLRLQSSQTNFPAAQIGEQKCRLPPSEKAGVPWILLTLLIWTHLSLLASCGIVG